MGLGLWTEFFLPVSENHRLKITNSPLGDGTAEHSMLDSDVQVA
jgi:hypothetical protein